MAYTSDVENALIEVATDCFYPAGPPSDPAMLSPKVGAIVHLSRGWPTPVELDAAMGANEVLVTVWQQSSHTRIVDGYLEQGYSFLGPPVSMTTAVSGTTITFGGTATPGQLAGAYVDGLTTAYVIQQGDSVLSVANAIAALLNQNAALLFTNSGDQITDDYGSPMSTTDFAVVDAGPPVTITVATNRPIKARSVGNGTVVSEYRWQEEVFRLITWAPTPAVRDAAMNALDLALAKLRFLTLPDSPMARVLWQSTERSDASMKSLLYRGDLCYTVRFATTEAVATACLLWGDLEVEKQIAGGAAVAKHTEIF